MIIICDKCSKKFNVNDEDIPETGRSLQCGNCGNKWFFKPDISEKKSDDKIDENAIIDKDQISSKETNITTQEELATDEIKIPKKIIEVNDDKKKKLIKNSKHKKTDEKLIKKKSNFVGIFFVTIITFIALIIILDTFKNELSQIIPSLIPLLDNLYQTMYDIYLFFKDLII